MDYYKDVKCTVFWTNFGGVYQEMEVDAVDKHLWFSVMVTIGGLDWNLWKFLGIYFY